MAWVAPVIAGGVALANGYMEYRNNKKAVKQQREQFSQEVDLADSSVQRRMRDLEAAGLNPILAGSGMGAVTPSSDPPRPNNPAQKVIEAAQTGMQAYMQRAQRTQMELQNANLDRQNKLLETQTTAAAQQARLTGYQADLLEQDLPYGRLNSATRALQATNQLNQSREQLAALIRQNRIGDETEQAQIETAIRENRIGSLTEDQRIALSELQQEYQTYLTQAEKLGLSEAEATSKFFEQTGTSTRWTRFLDTLKQFWGRK